MNYLLFSIFMTYELIEGLERDNDYLGNIGCELLGEGNVSKTILLNVI